MPSPARIDGARELCFGNLRVAPCVSQHDAAAGRKSEGQYGCAEPVLVMESDASGRIRSPHTSRGPCGEHVEGVHRVRDWSVWFEESAPYIVKIVQRFPDGSEVVSERAR